jgi:hypothetical protein
MISACTTCGEPATLSVRRDPFGKTDECDLYCMAHAPSYAFTACVEQRAPTPVFQHYWRCEHYPSALENFQNDRAPCGLCTEPPTWWSNGENRKPKSWGGHFDIGV